MTWFWSGDTSSGSSQPDAAPKKDVYANLDPKLQAFARKELDTPDTVKTDTASEPQYSSGNVDTARLNMKSRKSFINAGARFNCAIAEAELNECFTNGSWWDKAKLCELQKSTFWDCLEGNKKVLADIGYGEASNTEAENQTLLGRADDIVFSSTLRVC